MKILDPFNSSALTKVKSQHAANKKIREHLQARNQLFHRTVIGNRRQSQPRNENILGRVYATFTTDRKVSTHLRKAQR